MDRGKYSTLTLKESNSSYNNFRQSRLQGRLSGIKIIIMKKRSVLQEDIIILNVYIPNDRVSDCV